MKMINYINLSNGLEALDEGIIGEIRFMRLQSTSCEHYRWEYILDSLSDDFLLDVCAGNEIVVHDRACSLRAGGLSRAQWQGIEWVKYALSRTGFGMVLALEKPFKHVPGYWREVYSKLSSKTLGRLVWYSKWATDDLIRIRCVGGLAKHDGDSGWHKKVWKNWKEKEAK